MPWFIGGPSHMQYRHMSCPGERCNVAMQKPLLVAIDDPPPIFEPFKVYSYNLQLWAEHGHADIAIYVGDGELDNVKSVAEMLCCIRRIPTATVLRLADRIYADMDRYVGTRSLACILKRGPQEERDTLRCLGGLLRSKPLSVKLAMAHYCFLLKLGDVANATGIRCQLS